MKYGLFLACLGLVLCCSGSRAEYGGSCVRYVKTVKPEFDTSYTVNGKSKSWVNARDLYDFVDDWKKGAIPRAGAIFILESLYSGHPGHCGVVIRYKRDPRTKKVIEFTVKHSNWQLPGEAANQVSIGVYRFVGETGANAKVTYNGGSKQYTLRGFVYRP